MESQREFGAQDLDTSQFTDLLKTVWSMFESRICNDTEALSLLKSAASFISKDETFHKIEEEFKLGALGEYVVTDVDALPFLTTVMSHLNSQLDNDGRSSSQENQRKKRPHIMTTFWQELENKMGSSEVTKSAIEEITEKVSRVAQNLAVENSEFAQALSEIGVCMKDSWRDLKKEVDRCIKRVRKRNYSQKSMDKIYSRVICKGINTARTIQQKIISIKGSWMQPP